MLTLTCDAHCSVELAARAGFHHLQNTQSLLECQTTDDKTFWPADCAKISVLLKPDPEVMACLAKCSHRC